MTIEEIIHGKRHPPSHLAFLLRIWSVGESQPPVLRASLEDPRTRQLVSFTNLEDLFQYLRTESDPSRDIQV
jgi:hypothetical protein